MTDNHETFDFVIIGAGPAGEAALELAREGGQSVAIVDRDLFGGSCAYWACMPSKSLLHAAAVHDAGGEHFPTILVCSRLDHGIGRGVEAKAAMVPDGWLSRSNLRLTGSAFNRGRVDLVGPRSV